jgi:hypothetical protein
MVEPFRIYQRNSFSIDHVTGCVRIAHNIYDTCQYFSYAQESWDFPFDPDVLNDGFMIRKFTNRIMQEIRGPTSSDSV